MEIQITDSTGTHTLPALEVPFTELPLESAVDVVTLDFNIYTDFVSRKRQWSQAWAYLTQSQYEFIMGFYNRQFTDFRYPTISIPDLGISNVAVRMSTNQRDIIDNCGTVSGFAVTFRETVQIG